MGVKFPSDDDTVQMIRNLLDELGENVLCFVEYQTATGKVRTAQGKYQGVEKDRIVLLQGTRNNRVPINMASRMTYSIGDQGYKIEASTDLH